MRLTQVMRKAQVISLVLLTTGVMLANLGSKGEGAESNMTGILATIGISLGSGFAAVYTEKVIKKAKKAEAVRVACGAWLCGVWSVCDR